jgi:hypothetical protein
MVVRCKAAHDAIAMISNHVRTTAEQWLAIANYGRRQSCAYLADYTAPLTAAVTADLEASSRLLALYIGMDPSTRETAVLSATAKDLEEKRATIAACTHEFGTPPFHPDRTAGTTLDEHPDVRKNLQCLTNWSEATSKVELICAHTVETMLTLAEGPLDTIFGDTHPVTYCQARYGSVSQVRAVIDAYRQRKRKEAIAQRLIEVEAQALVNANLASPAAEVVAAAAPAAASADQPPQPAGATTAPAEEPPDFTLPGDTEVETKVETESGARDATLPAAGTPTKTESPEEKLEIETTTKEGMAHPVGLSPPEVSFLASIPARIAGSFSAVESPKESVLTAPTQPLPGTTETPPPTEGSASAPDVAMGESDRADRSEARLDAATESTDSSAKRSKH